jgi:glyoxylase-like metal-dependent hydrolase (beta-lactamase superfamily II)
MAHLWTGAALLDQAMLRATAARAQSANGALPALFDLQRVAPGVYAAIAKPLPMLNCNAAIFENEKDLLIVDSHARPSAVISLVQQLKREVTNKPVRYIVNSHFHWDHSEGNAAYQSAYPNAQIVSSATTRKLLREFGASRAKAQVEQAAAAVPGYRKSLEAAKSAEEKAYWRMMVQDSLAFAREMKDYSPELPHLTLETDLVIHDKAHDLHLAFRGKGHTAGDIVVFCPQKKVIATGDLLHSFAPYIGDGYPRSWPRTLRTVGGFEYAQVIGGHGGVHPSKLPGQQMAAYIEELSAEVANAKRRNLPLEQVRKQIHPGMLKSLTGGYGDFLSTSLTKYRFLKPHTPSEAILADAVAVNLGEIYTNLDRV